MCLDRVKAAQRRDPQLQKIRFEVQQGQSRDFVIDSKGTLRLDRLRFDHELEEWLTDWCYHLNC